MVAHDPLRGSGQAGLPHPALASGSDAKEAVQRIRMIDMQRGQPAVNQPPHPVPVHVAVLTAPADGLRCSGRRFVSGRRLSWAR
jgi:hypothetical protein